MIKKGLFLDGLIPLNTPNNQSADDWNPKLKLVSVGRNRTTGPPPFTINHNITRERLKGA